MTAPEGCTSTDCSNCGAEHMVCAQCGECSRCSNHLDGCPGCPAGKSKPGTVAALIARLEQLDPHMPVTRIWRDFPYPISEVELCLAYPYEDHWHVAFDPEFEDEPLTTIAVIR